MNQDFVFINQLEVITQIGAYSWEQDIKQKLLLDIEMTYDCQAAGQSDNLSQALDYSEVCNTILQHTDKHHFQLVERVAEDIAQLIITHFSVSKVKLRITKPNALLQAKGVGVIIERHTKKQ